MPASTFSAEKAQTPPRIFSLVVFFCRREYTKGSFRGKLTEGERVKSNRRLYFVHIKYPFEMWKTVMCCAIIITVITKINFKEITL